MPVNDWTQPISQTIQRHRSRGGFVVVFPEYRPHLFLTLAHSLKLVSFDFRAEAMSSHGWEADQLTLQDLDAVLDQQTATSGTLVHNVEALLSTKSDADCSRWIEGFLKHDRRHAILVPIVINAAKVPCPHPRVHQVPPGALSDQTLISRLSF